MQLLQRNAAVVVTVASVLLAARWCDAFAASTSPRSFAAVASQSRPTIPAFVSTSRRAAAAQPRGPAAAAAAAAAIRSALHAKADDDDNEIERLRSMAAQLRAEAAQLEAQQSQAMADAAEKAFRKFDTNQDGQVSLDELKAGLEKAFKMELPEKRVAQLMADFAKTGGDGDGGGDGATKSALKIDDFVSVEQFRSRLDALARDEKLQARQAADEAKQEDAKVKFIRAQLELINDRPPTGTDKIVSILPYLFPLLDGLQFARFLVLENPDNVFAGVIGIAYALYRSVPFGGLIAFFALNTLASNPSINRLVRFNMQQAIFVDIALFFPGLLAALYALVGQGLGFALPPAVAEIGSDVLFALLLTAVGYASISSLLGITPNKIPLIGEAVEARMPTVDMFDDQGRFAPRNPRKNDKNKNDDTDKDGKGDQNK